MEMNRRRDKAVRRSVSLPESLDEALMRRAKAEYRPVSWVFAEALRRYLRQTSDEEARKEIYEDA